MKWSHGDILIAGWETTEKKMNHQRLGAMAGVFVGRVAVEARQVGGHQVEGDPFVTGGIEVFLHG